MCKKALRDVLLMKLPSILLMMATFAFIWLLGTNQKKAASTPEQSYHSKIGLVFVSTGIVVHCASFSNTHLSLVKVGDHGIPAVVSSEPLTVGSKVIVHHLDVRKSSQPDGERSDHVAMINVATRIP